MNTRDKIVAALEASKGDYISGEELAESIGVSRNSIWKAIKTLKEQGYNIEAVTNKGYKLSVESDIISGQGISIHLKDKSLADCIEIYEELGSTNDLARKYLFIEASHKTDGSDKRCHIIIAREQTGGRGHNKSTFASPKGGIYMSIVLPAENISADSVSGHVGESVKKAVKDMTGIEPVSEKNNAIYMDDEKICGILTEVLSDYETGSISDYIIGIGIRYEILEGKSDKSEVTRNKLIAEIINRIL